jgi:UDP-N-acetylglucosamine 2-epimerase
MNKAALVVGTRPQFVKTAPLVMELGRFFKVVLIHTGQHYDFIMSENFFGELQIPDPDYHLEATEGVRGRRIGRMIDGLESVLDYEKPDLVIVLGDTNSTLAGALSASSLGLTLAHVEAGVRSKNLKLPEQINRLVTDSISDYFLCPTPSAVGNLKREGKIEHIHDTGDVIYDCLRLFQAKIPEKPANIRRLPEKFILATIHRAEAVDDPANLTNLLKSLGTSACPVIWPVHPRTRKRIDSQNLGSLISEKIILMNPVGYLDILSLIRLAQYVVTDSGGVQREAVFMKKPALIARPETEWRELETLGLVRVIGYSFNLPVDVEVTSEAGKELEHLTRPAANEIARILARL